MTPAPGIDRLILQALSNGPRSCGQIAAGTHHNLDQVRLAMYALSRAGRVATAGRGTGPTRPYLWALPGPIR